MITRISETQTPAPVASGASAARDQLDAGRMQHGWTALLAAVVLAGPWFLPSGSTRAPLTKCGAMSATDSLFIENGAGENMTARTRAALSQTVGLRPLIAVARAGDPEGSYLANLIQSIAWPRVVAVRYLDHELPTRWASEFDALILCHWGPPPTGARVVERDVVFIDPPLISP